MTDTTDIPVDIQERQAIALEEIAVQAVRIADSIESAVTIINSVYELVKAGNVKPAREPMPDPLIIYGTPQTPSENPPEVPSVESGRKQF